MAKTDLSEKEAQKRVKTKLNSAISLCKVQDIDSYFTFKWGVSETLKKGLDRYHFSATINIDKKINERNKAIASFMHNVNSSLKIVRSKYLKALEQIENYEKGNTTSKSQKQKLLNQIKKYLKEGKVKKANASYAQLISLLTAKEAKKLVQEIIKSIGKSGDYKVTTKAISKITKPSGTTGGSSSGSSKTGAKTTKKENVTTSKSVVTAAMILNYIKYEKKAQKQDILAARDENIANAYQEYMDAVNNLDPTDDNYYKNIEALRNDLNTKIQSYKDEAKTKIAALDNSVEAECKSKMSESMAKSEGTALIKSTKEKYTTSKASADTAATTKQEKIAAATSLDNSIDEKYNNGIARKTEMADEKALGLSKQAVVYEEAIDKINNVDLNSPDALDQIEDIVNNVSVDSNNIVTETAANMTEVSNKYGDNYANLTDGQIENAGDVGLNNSISAENYQLERKNTAASQLQQLVTSKKETIANMSKTETVATPESTSAESTATPTSNTATTVYSGEVTNSSENVAQAEPAVSAATVTTETPSYRTTQVQTSTEPAAQATTETPTPVVEESTNTTAGVVSSEPITDDSSIVEDEGDFTNVIDDTEPTTGTTTPSKKSSGAGVVPIALGLGALGAAGVAGYRYMKNKNNTDEEYDDEDNSEYFDDQEGEDIAPAGNSYQDADLYGDTSDDVPNTDTFTDTEDSADDFSEDDVLNNIS